MLLSIRERLMALSYPGHLILDSLQTWPAVVIDILRASERELRSFLEEERRVEELGRIDLIVRFSPPANPFLSSWRETTDSLSRVLESVAIIGFHCTRLVSWEIDNIRKQGLRPLSRGFTLTRIDRVYDERLIKADVANALSQINECDHEFRRDAVSFFHCLSSLQDESGLYRLFRCWGGEALYLHHENDSVATSSLRSLGVPCIIVATLRCDQVSGGASLAERLIRIWIERDNGLSHDCDYFVMNQVVPVVDVIERSDLRFEMLTRCASWSETV